jgi:hypothetical protein
MSVLSLLAAEARIQPLCVQPCHSPGESKTVYGTSDDRIHSHSERCPPSTTHAGFCEGMKSLSSSSRGRGPARSESFRRIRAPSGAGEPYSALASERVAGAIATYSSCVLSLFRPPARSVVCAPRVSPPASPASQSRPPVASPLGSGSALLAQWSHASAGGRIGQTPKCTQRSKRTPCRACPSMGAADCGVLPTKPPKHVKHGRGCFAEQTGAATR